MRILLDPEKLANYSLSAAEALAAVQEQDSQSPGGQMGDLPISGETELNAAILTHSRFTTPEQLGKIILRANPDGSAITLSDVARVELGAQNYLFDSDLNGKPVAGLAVQMTPGPNALAHAAAVETHEARMAATLPSDT